MPSTKTNSDSDEDKLGYKFRLYPNAKQEELMNKTFGCCRKVWNLALQHIAEVYKRCGKYPSEFELNRQITEWKKEYKYLQEVSTDVLQQSMRDLSRAVKAYKNKTAGKPKFKKKGQHDGFREPWGTKEEPKGRRIEDEDGRSYVKIQKMERIRYIKTREIEGTIKNVTITREAGQWYVSFQVERDKKAGSGLYDKKGDLDSAIGIDLGVNKFYATSNGEVVKPIDFTKQVERVERLQKKLARCKKPKKQEDGTIERCANREKVRMKYQREWKRIRDRRMDFLHKLSTMISKNHAYIMLEDLKVRKMTKSASGTKENPGKNVKKKKNLNRMILRQGWREFRRQLEYKTKWYGGEVVIVDPRDTSKTCNKCGNVDKANRNKSQFKCTKCMHEADADINAAKNIMARGIEKLREEKMHKQEMPVAASEGQADVKRLPSTNKR